jgi:type II secretory pathway pseudopilin PulG
VSRHLRLPMVLIPLAGILATILLFLLPAQDAKAPEQTASSSQERAQDEAQAGTRAVTATRRRPASSTASRPTRRAPLRWLSCLTAASS